MIDGRDLVTMPIGVCDDGTPRHVIVGEVVRLDGERWDAFAHDWSTPDDDLYRPVRIGTLGDRQSAVDEIRGRAPSQVPRPGDRAVRRPQPVPSEPQDRLPWHAHRAISAQDGYFWTFSWPDKFVRVVYRTDDGSATVEPHAEAVGTVNVHVAAQDNPDHNAPFAAFSSDEEWLAASGNPNALAQVVALHDRAARLAAPRAVVDARAGVADHTARHTGPDVLEEFKRCVERAGFLDWDMDYGPVGNPLSGRHGHPTPLSLLDELDCDPDPDGTIQVGLALRYVAAYRDAWRGEILRIARERIAQAELAEQTESE